MQAVISQIETYAPDAILLGGAVLLLIVGIKVFSWIRSAM